MEMRLVSVTCVLLMVACLDAKSIEQDHFYKELANLAMVKAGLGDDLDLINKPPPPKPESSDCDEVRALLPPDIRDIFVKFPLIRNRIIANVRKLLAIVNKIGKTLENLATDSALAQPLAPPTCLTVSDFLFTLEESGSQPSAQDILDSFPSNPSDLLRCLQTVPKKDLDLLDTIIDMLIESRTSPAAPYEAKVMTLDLDMNNNDKDSSKSDDSLELGLDSSSSSAAKDNTTADEAGNYDEPTGTGPALARELRKDDDKDSSIGKFDISDDKDSSKKSDSGPDSSSPDAGKDDIILPEAGNGGEGTGPISGATYFANALARELKKYGNKDSSNSDDDELDGDSSDSANSLDLGSDGSSNVEEFESDDKVGTTEQTVVEFGRPLDKHARLVQVKEGLEDMLKKLTVFGN